MSIAVLWEAHFGQGHASQGQAIIKRIWDDMTGFAGYVDHETIVDMGDPGHVFVISHWRSKEAADQVLQEYRWHRNAVEADRLAIEPRRRTVGVTVDHAAKAV